MRWRKILAGLLLLAGLNASLAAQIVGPRAAVLSAAASAQRWQFPAWFTNGTFPVNLVGSPGDSSFSTTYASANFENSGTGYCVDAIGNDTTGTGATGSCWRTIQKAVDTVAAGSKITVGAGRFANFTVASKNLSIYGAGPNLTFVGDLLTESDISWGLPSSNRQTATLASSTVSGFVDTTLLRRGYPQVSMVATTAAGIATYQSSGFAGVYRSTPSQVGAGDLRNLSGKADTEILVWKATAAAPVVLSGTTQLFVKDMSFVGGGENTIASGTRLVADNCWFLGGHGQPVQADGTILFNKALVRGTTVAGSDVLDYGGGRGVEIDTTIDQCGTTGADNCSTGHGALIMRVGGNYLDGSRSINDVQGGIVGMFGSYVQPAGVSGSLGLGAGDGNAYFAAITFGPRGSGDDMMLQKSTSWPTAFVNFYDGSWVGKTKAVPLTGAQNAIEVTDRSGPRDAGNTVLFEIDPSNISTLCQDTACNTPVTAPGDPVLRMNNPNNPSEYATVFAGTLTYQSSGGLSWLQTGGAGNNLRILLNLTTTYLDEKSNLIYGIKSSDTSGYLLSNGGVNRAGDIQGSTGPLTPATSPLGFGVGSPTYYVDGGTAVTTPNGLKAAAFNNVGHIVTIRNANLAWVGWMRTSTSGGVLMQFDGNFYGFEINRAANDNDLRARETIMAAKASATLVN